MTTTTEATEATEATTITESVVSDDSSPYHISDEEDEDGSAPQACDRVRRSSGAVQQSAYDKYREIEVRTPKAAPTFFRPRGAGRPVLAKAVLAPDQDPWLWFPSQTAAVRKCLGKPKTYDRLVGYGGPQQRLGWWFKAH